jgi:hypothetical protein
MMVGTNLNRSQGGDTARSPIATSQKRCGLDRARWDRRPCRWLHLIAGGLQHGRTSLPFVESRRSPGTGHAHTRVAAPSGINSRAETTPA